MSSRYVRVLVEEWLKDASMLVPYYETINKEENPREDMWCTVSFLSSYRDRMTFCQGLSIEEGEVEVKYSGLPGKGYDALIQALEIDMVTLMAQRDPQGKFILMRRSAPFDASSGSAELMYSLSVYVDYQLYE